MTSSPDLGAAGVLGAVPGRVEEPTHQRLRPNRCRFFRKDNEYGLRDVLGKIGVPELAAGGGVNEIEVPLDELLKRLRGMAQSIFAQQIAVVGYRCHSSGIVR